MSFKPPKPSFAYVDLHSSPPKKELDPVYVTTCLSDLVLAFVGETEAKRPRTPPQSKRQLKAIGDCFRLFLGRGPTKDEIRHIAPW